MAELTEEQTDLEMEKMAKAYDSNYRDYQRYMSELDWDTKEVWLPIIYGCMLGEPLRDFFTSFNWDKPEDEQMIVPPCGEMPPSVCLVCYHAKRLDPVVIDNILPSDAKEVYDKQRKKLLYGSDALSVIEYFEVGL